MVNIRHIVSAAVTAAASCAVAQVCDEWEAVPRPSIPGSRVVQRDATIIAPGVLRLFDFLAFTNQFNTGC